MNGLDWWYQDSASQTRIGPLSAAGLLALLDSRIITLKTRIWREDMPWWLPLEQVEDFEAQLALRVRSALPA